MAKRKTTSTAAPKADTPKAPRFRVDPRAKKTPRRYYLKSESKWVGIGGSIRITPKPPGVPVTIPEATEAQYLKIAETCPLVEKL